MIILIHKGENVSAFDSNGVSDPFAKVFYDFKEVGCTEYAKKTVNPVWKSAVTFELREECKRYYAVLEIWDKDDLSSNDLMSCCRLPLVLPADGDSGLMWVKLVKGKSAQGRVLVEMFYDDKDKRILEKRRLKTDIRDIYPPHNGRFKSLYHHIPRAWHPDRDVRLKKGPTNVVIPQDEYLLHMIEEVTLTFHINESSNIGELATMVLTNYRLWFIPYQPLEAFEDVHTISVGKILSTSITSKKKRVDGKSIHTFVIEILVRNGGIYHVIMSNSIPTTDFSNVSMQQDRMQHLETFADEIAWLKAENNFCYTTSQSHVMVQKAGIFKTNDQINDTVRNPYDLLQAQVQEKMLILSSIGGSKRKPAYNLLLDYRRMGALEHPKWRTTDINATYQFCPSYPNVLIVPASISDECLVNASKYRSKQRLPCLTWIHPLNGATICRSSQPHSGVMRADNVDDTNLIWAIRAAAMPKDIETQVPSSLIIHIVDARPEINAKSNALAGKGHESSTQYDRHGSSTASIVFMGIENIHVVRSSFATFSAAFYTSDDSTFFACIQRSRWLEHVVSILSGGVEVAQHLHRGEPVLVHCSDGWDRTAQLSALAQIMLDPYYRTMAGFAVLVEKDWCSFGHMFEKRCGYPTSDDTSPIFLLFLDAVFQLTCQFPTFFQFNAAYLFDVCEAVYSGWFGNFLKNTEKERADAHKAGNCMQLWDALRAATDHYLNPLFKPLQGEVDSIGEPMIPVCKVRSMQIWSGMYQSGISHVRLQRRENEMLALIQSQEDQITMMSRVLTSNQHIEIKAREMESEIQHLARSFELDHLDVSTRNVLLSRMDTPRSARSNTSATSDFDLAQSNSDAIQEEVRQLESQLDSLKQQLEEKNILAASIIDKLRKNKYNLASANEIETMVSDSQIMDKHTLYRISAPIWQDDQDAACCKHCKKKFKAILRGKHHCRCCGYVFCGKCSNYFIQLPELGYYDNVRVCSLCQKAAQTADEEL